MAGAAPLNPTWIAAIHGSEDDFEPLGTAVVIDERRVLTCAHVVADNGGVRPGLWVAFPMSEEPGSPRLRVSVVRLAAHPMSDLAMLEVDDLVPSGVAAAPLRCPKPADVLDRAW